MKVIRRTDSIPSSGKAAIERLTNRALKSGLKIVRVLERTIDGVDYKTFVLEGSRLSVIKYYGVDIVTGNFRKREILGLLKIMFL